MSSAEDRYIRYLNNSTEESREHDETFAFIEREYADEVEEARLHELLSIFDGFSEWYADQIFEMENNDPTNDD